MIGDLGATTTAGGVVVGHRLGLYTALAQGTATPDELAGRTGTDPRYVAEWLAGQAAGGYVEYDPATGAFHLTPEQAFALADPAAPLPAGCLRARLGALRAEPRITEAFRTGAGMAGTSTTTTCSLAASCCSAPGYTANPSRPGCPRSTVSRTSRAGGRVADVGCGLGSSSVLLAQAFPRATVSASDYHEDSVRLARKRVAEAGVADRVSVETASAQAFSGTGYDLVATFDCLHDMGDSLARPATSAPRWPPTAPGWWSSRGPATPSRTTSIRSVAPTTASPFLCVPNARSSPAATASAPRPVRPPSGRSPRTPGSPGSAGRRRRR